MVANPKFSESDPRHHTCNIRRMLEEVIDHAREDVTKVNDPKAKVLFEMTAEVLTGVKTAYDHFEQASEPAFRG